MHLEQHQIDAIVAKFERRSPTTFRARPVRNFLSTLGNMSISDAHANCDMDARLYNWKSPIVTAIREGINLAARNSRTLA